MRISRLTEAEHSRVTDAVRDAEHGTDGEIVTIVTARSDEYHDIALHYAVGAMLLVVAGTALCPGAIDAAIARLSGGWAGDPVPWRSFVALMVAEAIVFLVVRSALVWMPLRMALTPKAVRARRVRRRAIDYFRVGAERRTTARVGILLYLSLDEHNAEIIADEAIHRQVPAERWGDAMAALVDEVRAGRPGEGMAAAVTQIGMLLAETFPKTEADTNELPDRLIEL
ncbi:TPM domain-containing protein [Hephaestia sp. GCM10023244]|uniref:TPM domain-containing protein n=1 Tax=unclassified Hephaestia TaxID=2631281 RepID=UPI0020770D60|nr:hypothetical protein [Hephaestia sp. MAHUQ-44]MCM8731877.1 hypothetical protein [Hephaestia sp. MAHUQ-44]